MATAARWSIPVSRSPWRHLLGSLPPSCRSCQGSPLIPRLCVFPWRCSCCGVSGFGMRREVRHDWSVWGREGSAWQAADAFFLAGWQQTASGVNRVLTDSLPSVTPSVTKYWLGGRTDHLWSSKIHNCAYKTVLILFNVSVSYFNRSFLLILLVCSPEITANICGHEQNTIKYTMLEILYTVILHSCTFDTRRRPNQVRWGCLLLSKH